VIDSAPGKLFAAFLPVEQTEELVMRELKETNVDPQSFYEELKEIRRKGFSLTEGSVIPGIMGISCPIFSQDGEMIAALTVIAWLGSLDKSEESEDIHKIRSIASEISRQLGYKPKF
jgi:DNA-binding IclR family transcriptional regulator